MTESSFFTAELRQALSQSIPLWEAEAREHEAAIEARTKALRSVQSRINAAHVLLQEEEETPPRVSRSFAAIQHRGVLTVSPPPAPGENITWAAFAINTLRATGRPMEYAEIIASMAGTPLEPRMKRSPSSFYARMAKLVATGRLVRDGKLLSLPPKGGSMSP